MNMIDKKSWEEFRNSKLLWVANRTLHLFGWAIVCQMEDNKVVDVYPARVKFRGFDSKSEEEGFIGLAEYVDENSKELLEEAKL